MNTISSILKFIAETITPICGTPTGNKVLASPNGSSGAPAFRSLAVNDVPAVIRPPVGTIQMYAGASAPSGWLLCNGQAVSRSTYSALFSVLGTAYGVGDGSTTFNLPDFRDRVAVGGGLNYTRASAGGSATRSYTPAGVNTGGGVHGHVLTVAQMPTHAHGFESRYNGDYALARTSDGDFLDGTLPVSGGTMNFHYLPTTSNTGGGSAHSHGFTQPTFRGTAATIDVRQPYLGVYFIIYTGVA